MMVRPKRAPPHDAAPRIEKLASEGWALKAIAKTLGTDHETLRRLMADHPDLQSAYDAGRERERMSLHGALFKAAMAGQIAAAMFLLKCKHNYRETGEGDGAARLNITFSLPGALKPEQFTIENDEPATSPERQRLPTPRA